MNTEENFILALYWCGLSVLGAKLVVDVDAGHVWILNVNDNPVEVVRVSVAATRYRARRRAK